MAKSSSVAGRQLPVTTPLHRLIREPQTLRRAHAAAHRFVELFEAEVEDAVHSARARQLAPVKRIEQTVRYLHLRHPLTDQAAGTHTRKPSGFSIEPDFVLAMKALDAAPLGDYLSAIHGAIAALEPYDGVPFKRKPIGFRKAGSMAGAATAGPEEAALAALELAGRNLISLFRSLEQRLAASCTTSAARRKTPKGKPSGMLTPPQVAKQLGVSPDKVRGWIDKGELDAVDVAAGSGGRRRNRISEEDLAKFLKDRQNVKPPPKPPPKPPLRNRKDPGVIEFFK